MMKKYGFVTFLGALFAPLLIGACGTAETVAKDVVANEDSTSIDSVALADTVAAPTWKCEWSTAGGQQYKTCRGGSCKGRIPKAGEICENGSLFYCKDGSPLKDTCSNGCIVGPDRTDDQCR